MRQLNVCVFAKLLLLTIEAEAKLETPRPNADTKKKVRHQSRGLVFGARDFAKVHLLSSQQFVLKRRPDAKQRKRVSSP